MAVEIASRTSTEACSKKRAAAGSSSSTCAAPRSDIRRIATTYTDGTPGEPVAMFNAMGLLEIAICMGGSGSGYGGATDLLGLKYEDPVRIEFAAAQAAPTLEL